MRVSLLKTLRQLVDRNTVHREHDREQQEMRQVRELQLRYAGRKVRVHWRVCGLHSPGSSPGSLHGARTAYSPVLGLAAPPRCCYY